LNFFVTGAAGFIGSNLVDRLLALGHAVTGYDNFSTGQEEFLKPALDLPNFRLVRADLLDFEALHTALEGADFVFHLAANADVRYGTQHPRKDLEQNTLATWNLLEAMREHGIRRIGFTSTGSIYGEPEVFPTPEDCPFPVQTSFYGAAKLAAESLIQAYSNGFGFEGTIFRLVSVLGERYSHGHVFDFFRQLQEHPDRLDILGDGHQRKSYIYVQDCIDAMLLSVSEPRGKMNIFNVGTNDYCEVTDSVEWICGSLGVKPIRTYSGGQRGWVGDSPFIFLECSRLRNLGWIPKITIRDAVIKTVDYLRVNPWLMQAR
jgi:UDP-glucose 4-epimerase